MADGTISIDVELNEKAFKSSLENMGTIVRSGADLMIKSVGDLSRSFVLLPGTVTYVLGSVPNIINGVINHITGKIPVMTKAGTDFFTSLIQDMPDIINKISDTVPEITGRILNKFVDFMPNISDTGGNFFTSLISKMPEVISNITGAIPEITERITEAIGKDTSLISEAGYNLFCSLTGSLPSAMKEISAAPGQIISMLLAKFNSLTGQFKSVGENIVYGVWAGISGMASWLAASVTGFFQSIVGGVTSFLGISSPSKLFRDLVGKNIALGVGAGIGDEMPYVIADTKKYMKILTDTANENMRFTPNASDILSRTNSANITKMADIQNILQEQSQNNNQKQTAAQQEINVTLEPTGDIRGFFDYISMGVKRSDYLNGGAKA